MRRSGRIADGTFLDQSPTYRTDLAQEVACCDGPHPGCQRKRRLLCDAYTRERAGICALLLPYGAEPRIRFAAVLGRCDVVQYATRAKHFVELVALRIVGIFRLFFGVKVL